MVSGAGGDILENLGRVIDTAVSEAAGVDPLERRQAVTRMILVTPDSHLMLVRSGDRDRRSQETYSLQKARSRGRSVIVGMVRDLRLLSSLPRQIPELTCHGGLSHR